jgi:nucleotide-binding universal stress UspA family protein
MKVLVPFDFTVGVQALRHSFQMYEDTEKVEIHAVHFSDTPNKTSGDIAEKEVRNLFNEVVDTGSNLEETDLTIDTQGVEQETRAQVSEAIQDYAERENIDQVIMSSHNRSLLSRLFDKSTADRILDSDVASVTVIEPIE